MQTFISYICFQQKIGSSRKRQKDIRGRQGEQEQPEIVDEQGLRWDEQRSKLNVFNLNSD